MEEKNSWYEKDGCFWGKSSQKDICPCYDDHSHPNIAVCEDTLEFGTYDLENRRWIWHD